jgi:hypothetical protein
MNVVSEALHHAAIGVAVADDPSSIQAFWNRNMLLRFGSGKSHKLTKLGLIHSIQTFCQVVELYCAQKMFLVQ